jgi:GNAT superfamily N-acetyltransferase
MMGSLWLREGHGHLVVDDRDIAVFLAIEGQRGIGFADIGPVRRESGKRVAELFAIYLDPAHIGQGWGKALFDACAAHCRALGFQSLESKVFSQNKRARGFYERQGGEPLRDSETEIDAGGALVKVITYRWEELPV